MRQPPFATRLFECDDDTSVRTAKGARFLRKLPDDRDFGYLHKPHAPLDQSDAAKLESELGRRLPGQYREFLLWANGGSLFDNQISLYGYVEHFTRSQESLDDLTPISLIWENQISPLERWEQGWTRVGGAAGWDSVYHLELHQDGRCAFVREPEVHVAASFDECLELLIGRVATCFSCDGLVDESYSEFEAALASLIHTQ